MEQDIHTRLMQQLQGQEGIERAMIAAQNAYPRLFAQIEELVTPNGSNADEISDYLLHVIEAFVQLQQSPLVTNSTCHEIFNVFSAVEQSYHLPPNAAQQARASIAPSSFALTLDTALMITLLAMMAGLKDLKTIASYSNYANQYLQLLLPAMMHPRYRISSVNCRTVMRLFNYELLHGFLTNFFTRAKVATQLSPASLLGQVQPSLAQLPQKGLQGLNYHDLAGFIPCLGLDHGLLLGPRALLFLCADRLLLNDYDYLLSLNHLQPQAVQQLQLRLAQRSRSKFLIDKIDPYYDLLDEISEDMRSVVCIRRRNNQGLWEDFFFVSTLEPNTSSLYRIQADYGDCEIALQQNTSYLMSVAKNEEELKDDFLPQRDDFNRFIVDVLNHERKLIEQVDGVEALRPWEEVLFRNGTIPHYAMACLCYYFLADVLDPKSIAQQHRQQMLSTMSKPSLTTILRSSHGFNPNSSNEQTSSWASSPSVNRGINVGTSSALGAPNTIGVPSALVASNALGSANTLGAPNVLGVPSAPSFASVSGQPSVGAAAFPYRHSSPLQAQASSAIQAQASSAMQAQLQAQAQEQARVFAQQAPRSVATAGTAPAAGTTASAVATADSSVTSSTDYRMGPGMDMVYRPRRIYGSHAYARARMAYAQTQGLDDLPSDASQLSPYPQGSAAARLTQMNQSATQSTPDAVTVHEQSAVANQRRTIAAARFARNQQR